VNKVTAAIFRQVEGFHADRSLFQGAILGLMQLNFLSVTVFVACARHLLCRDHAGRGLGVPDSGLATFGSDRWRVRRRYSGPDTSLAFEVIIVVLLIVAIGGMGTMYGALVGSAVFVVAQRYLQDLLKLAGDAAAGLLWLAALLSPDRWLLRFGVLFVLSVYYFPAGVVRRLRAGRERSWTRQFFNDKPRRYA
jgi:hypothetical protein